MTKKLKPTSTLPPFYLKSSKLKADEDDNSTIERHPSLNDPDWYFMNAALQKSEFKNYSATKDSLMDLPSNASIVENQNKANPRYNISLGGFNSSSKIQTSKKCSLITKKPYKILDAPNLKTNSVYNVFDWNNENCLIIGLGDKAYTWDNLTEGVKEVYSVNNNITACSWIKGANYFGIGLSNGVVDVIHHEKQKKIRSFLNNESAVCKIHYYSPEKTVIIGNELGNVYFHDLREKESLKFAYNHKGAVCHIESEPSNYLIATAGNDNNIVLTDLRRCNYNDNDIIITEGNVSVLKFSRLTQKTLFYCDDKNLTRKLLLNNKIISRPITEPVLDLVFYDPKNKDYYTELVAVCNDKFVSYEYNSMKKIGLIKTENDNNIVKCSQNKNNDKIIVSTSDDEKIRFWNLFGDDKSIQNNKDNNLMRNIRL